MFKGVLFYGIKRIETMNSRILAAFIILLLLVNADAEALNDPEFIWASSAGGILNSSGRNAVIDNYGNIYITGCFEGISYFGGIELASEGKFDIYIAKLDNSGQFIWAKKAGGAENDRGTGIFADYYGNIFITGYYESTASFGTLQLISEGCSDIFIARLNQNGDFIWAKSAGGPQVDHAYGISADSSGNIFITGYFEGNADFGDTCLVSSGMSDIFISGLDLSGGFLWSKKAGGLLDDFGIGISSGNDNSIYIIGHFSGICGFDGTQLSSAGGFDIFMAGIDKNGNFIWSERAGGPGNDYGISISSDDDSYICSTGYFSGTAVFGADTLVSNGGFDIFAARLDPEGSFIWARQAGGISYDRGYAIASNSSGSSYISGFFRDTASFGKSILSSSGSSDIFIAKIDKLGNFLWAQKAGGTLDESVYGICIDNNGNSFISGYFYGTALFGEFELISQGGHDSCIASLTDPSFFVEIESFSANGSGTEATIAWETCLEPDVQGFWLYRLIGKKVSPFVSYAPVLLNQTMIPGQGTASGGYSYSITDHVKPGSIIFYILEIVSASGDTLEYKTRLQWQEVLSR